MPFGNIYDSENLRDPNRFKPDDQMMYAGENPELRQMMKGRKAAAFTGMAPKRIDLEDPNLGTTRTTIANPNAGKLQIEGGTGGFTDTDMNAISRGAFRDYDLANARDTNGDGKPDWAEPKAARAYNHSTGEYFEMAKSGPRISGNKAREFADRFKQEEAGREVRADKNKAQALAERKLGIEEQNAATLRQRAESDYKTKQMMDSQAYERGQQQMTATQEDRVRDRRLAERGDAEYVSPEKQRQRKSYEAMAQSPNPKVRAFGMAQLAKDTGMEVPADVQSAMAQGAPGERGQRARAAVDDPLVAAPIQRAKQEVTRLTANVPTFGFRSVNPAEVSRIADLAKQSVTQAMSLAPDEDPAIIRQTIINQILADLDPSQAPNIAQAITAALEGG